MMKKLRMMLQTGIPMAAVEQRAKLEGIEMAEVLGQNKNKMMKRKNNTSTLTIPTPLLKKYKRMIKSGVPLQAVQTQASLDGRWTPDQVQEALSDLLEDPDKKKTPNASPPQHAHTYFTCHDKDLLSFPGASPLAALVRKMVQTVQKRVTTSKDDSMVVDTRTLYHALGALQGVQMARDAYHATIGTNIDPSSQEVKAKRQAFGEIAKTIGMELPSQEEATFGYELMAWMSWYVTFKRCMGMN